MNNQIEKDFISKTDIKQTHIYMQEMKIMSYTYESQLSTDKDDRK